VRQELKGSKKFNFSTIFELKTNNFITDIAECEVTKSTSFTAFFCHKYYQTSFGISKGLLLPNKLLKVVPNNRNVDVWWLHVLS